jgi:hypothetical protein
MFSIDSDKVICYTDESRSGALNFSSEAALQTIADREKWTREDLEAIWNDMVGAVPFDKLKPVKKFRNRPYGIRQIWNAIQRLVPADAPKPAKAAKPAKDPKEPMAPKPETLKRSRVAGESTKDRAIQMMLRKDGTTAAELKETLGWNTNSVSMMVQWLKLVTRNSVKAIAVEKNGEGERVYRASA